MKFLAVSTTTGDPGPYVEAEGARIAALMRSGGIERVLVKTDWSGR